MREAQRRAGCGAWVRHHARLRAEPAKLYTWWGYRAADWQAVDRGRRLDHIWVSPAIAGRVSSMAIARQARGWSQPSDHVPVTATLEL
jgi:exodeoxyribonuclease-3